MRKFNSLVLIFLLLFFLRPGLSLRAEYAGPAIINGDGVRLRAESNTDSAILAVMDMDAAVVVGGIAGDWYKIEYGSQTGYALGIYVTLPVVPDESVPLRIPLYAENKTNGYVNGDNVRLRERGSTESAVLATMKKGAGVNVLNTESYGWSMVSFGPITGYIANEFITVSDFPLGIPFPDLREEIEIIPILGPEPGVINNQNVRLRAQPGTNSAILATMDMGTKLSVLNHSGDWYEVRLGDRNGFVLGEYITLAESLEAINYSGGDLTSPSFSGPGPCELVDWSEGREIMTPGTKAFVTDVASGISFEIRVLANGSHADVEPVTAFDTAAILRARGEYSWDARAVKVTVNGRTMAASCNGMPHDVSTIANNNFPGHFCIHFYNSRNHYNNSLDAGHQKQVEIAVTQ